MRTSSDMGRVESPLNLMSLRWLISKSTARPSECAEKLATAFGLRARAALASAVLRSRCAESITRSTPSARACSRMRMNDSRAWRFSFQFSCPGTGTHWRVMYSQTASVASSRSTTASRVLLARRSGRTRSSTSTITSANCSFGPGGPPGKSSACQANVRKWWLNSGPRMSSPEVCGSWINFNSSARSNACCARGVPSVSARSKAVLRAASCFRSLRVAQI